MCGVDRRGRIVGGDATRYGAAGTLYVAGDPAVTSAVVRAVELVERPQLRVWVLGPVPAGDDPAARIRFPIDDPRLERKTVLIAVTELGSYFLAARPVAPNTLLAYHASDLDLVEGLAWSLQTAYHLQPELR